MCQTVHVGLDVSHRAVRVCCTPQGVSLRLCASKCLCLQISSCPPPCACLEGGHLGVYASVSSAMALSSLPLGSKRV